MTYKKWAASDDKVIIETIKRHPENLSYCFHLASKKLNTTDRSVAERYYRNIRPNLSEEEPTIFVGSPKKIIVNTKMVKRSNNKAPKSSFTTLKAKWKKIIEIIKEN